MRGLDPRHDAPVDRPGGERGRLDPAASRRRLHPVDASRSRSLHRQRRRSGTDARRVLRQGDRLLPRARRLDAHRRHRRRQPRCERHRRRRPADRGRCGHEHQGAEAGPRLHGVLRRRRDQRRARSTKRSTWRRSGSCPSCSSARTTSTAMSMDIALAMAVPNVADRASAYAMPGVAVDGNDLPAVAAASRGAVVARARRRWTVADRVQDLSSARPFQERPQPVSHQGRDRRVAQARSDHSPRKPSSWQHGRFDSGRACGDCESGTVDDRAGARICEGEPRSRSRRS